MPRWNPLVSIPARLKPYLALLLWAGIPLLIRSSQQSLMGHDEGWYAQQARWIVESGDWVTQQWWGEPIYDRAMGMQWAIAAAYKLFGVSDAIARLPGVLTCFAAILLLYDIARRCVPEQLAWWSAAILAATPIWMQSGRLATQDVPLTAIELLSVWALLQAESNPTRQGAWRWLAGAGFGLGFAVKSFMVVLASIGFLPYLLGEHRRHRHVFSPALYAGLVTGFIPVAVWLGLSTYRYDSLPFENLFGLLFQLSREDFHNAGALYYFWNIPANAFPWPLLAIPGIALALRQSDYQRKWLWIGFPATLFVLLCLFKTRTWYYPLQLMPFASLLAAVTLDQLASLYRRSHGLSLALSGLLGAIASVLLIMGVALLCQVPLFELDAIYGWLGLAIGMGWLVPCLASWRDRRMRGTFRQTQIWKWGWILGPWSAIVAFYATGLWGNFNPEIRTALVEPPLAAIVQTESVDFVFSADDPLGAAADAVVLTYYTPHLGDRLTTPRKIQPGHYAWMRDREPQEIPSGTEIVGRAARWQLLYRPPQ